MHQFDEPLNIGDCIAVNFRVRSNGSRPVHLRRRFYKLLLNFGNAYRPSGKQLRRSPRPLKYPITAEEMEQYPGERLIETSHRSP